ncbi:unnamed protein product [Ambrosiozyma monospora]|uniref:Unnamed protein product n=1 Tax=Ambrosiozyma monospora TaxID=43982 RepID=A0ACB5TWC6_AMBMO|nr:unnamed protein product [Ambrosiozyma monospora]
MSLTMIEDHHLDTDQVYDWLCKMMLIMTKFHWVFLGDGRCIQSQLETRVWGKLDINNTSNKFVYYDLSDRLKRAFNIAKKGSRSHPPSENLLECTLDHKFCPFRDSNNVGVPCIQVQAAVLKRLMLLDKLIDDKKNDANNVNDAELNQVRQ